LKTILDEFCNQSGQLINYHKSTLTYSKNATATQCQLVAGIFNITHSESLGKYLGCPIFQQRINSSLFQGLINKATTKLDGCKANSLSKAGRTVLIQFHLEALPAHTMQCFELPKAMMNQLDNINREFFWKKSNTYKGMKMIAWDRVCMPKVKGGLGLRKAEAINKAFQCELAWKVISKEESIWVRVMRTKYLKQNEFLSCLPKSTDSPVWKNILKSRQLIREGLVWKVGTGTDISFWFDNWIGNKNLIQHLDIEDDLNLDPSIRVSEFILNGQWDIQKLNQKIHDHLVLQKIIGIALPILETVDSFCWD